MAAISVSRANLCNYKRLHIATKPKSFGKTELINLVKNQLIYASALPILQTNTAWIDRTEKVRLLENACICNAGNGPTTTEDKKR